MRLVIQVEGNLACAGDALMLDCDGFVSETNATNIVSVYLYALLPFHALNSAHSSF